MRVSQRAVLQSYQFAVKVLLVFISEVKVLVMCATHWGSHMAGGA